MFSLFQRLSAAPTNPKPAHAPKRFDVADLYRGPADVVAATEADWSAEYLAPILAVRIVDGIDAAMEHIARYGSQHTDAIVTEDYSHALRFLREVDSSSVMVFAGASVPSRRCREMPAICPAPITASTRFEFPAVSRSFAAM